MLLLIASELSLPPLPPPTVTVSACWHRPTQNMLFSRARGRAGRAGRPQWGPPGSRAARQDPATLIWRRRIQIRRLPWPVSADTVNAPGSPWTGQVVPELLEELGSGLLHKDPPEGRGAGQSPADAGPGLPG